MTLFRHQRSPLPTNWISALLASLVTLVCLHSAEAGQDPSIYQHKAARDLVAMVNKAADVFAEKGEEAFQEFARPGSRWLRGEQSIFAFDESGVCVFNPRHPVQVGKNLIDVEDVRGKPAHRWLVEMAKDRARPYGWVHYLSPPPQGLFPLWTSSYAVGVRSPEGKLYTLGSVLYNMRPERQFIVDLVDRAADLIARQGVEAFSTLRDEASDYNLLDTKVYVFTPAGELRVDPAYPPEAERNALDYQDSVGHYFIRDAIDRLKKSETAWVTYMWPRPGETTPSKKVMYVRRVRIGDETFFVGSDLFASQPVWMHL